MQVTLPIHLHSFCPNGVLIACGYARKKEVNSFAAPLLLSSSADYLQKWADTFMLGILSSSSAVGIYAVSMRVGGFIQIPLTAFNMVFAPMISEMASLGETKRLAENPQVGNSNGAYTELYPFSAWLSLLLFKSCSGLEKLCRKSLCIGFDLPAS